jgi:MOSC domain-containing protein YiiM
VKILSINVGRPRQVEWRDQVVTTSIFKDAVPGPVPVGTLNLDGDAQSDLSVHGGVAKAVYAYPSEPYALWKAELAGTDLEWGAFGENLTTEGLTETRLRIGDRLRIGSAGSKVTQPRLPCFKLGIRLDRSDIVKRFHQSGRSGFYLAVEQEGHISPGDAVKVLPTADRSMTVAAIASLYTAEGADPELLRQASTLPDLPESWREQFRGRL